MMNDEWMMVWDTEEGGRRKKRKQQTLRHRPIQMGELHKASQTNSHMEEAGKANFPKGENIKIPLVTHFMQFF
jgi:hypothetical protein